MNESCKES